MPVTFTYNGSSTVPTAAGSYAVVATVNDPNTPGTASGTLVISKAAATATLGNLAQTYTGSPLAATATTVPANLAVTFTYGGSATAPTAAGSYAVVATVNDPNYQGSASGTLVISQTSATATATTCSLSVTGGTHFGQARTYTARIDAGNGSPTGTVTFQDAANSLGSVQLSGGTAVFTTTTLAVGTHSITASYGGDAANLPSQSTALPELIDDPALVITSTTPSMTIATGGTATGELTLSTLGALTSPITLSATGLPANMSLTFSPRTLDATTTPVTVRMELKTTLASTVASLLPRSGVNLGGAFLVCGFLVAPFASRRRRAGFLFTGLALLVAVGLTGCGSSSNGSSVPAPSVIPAGTYPVTITATSAGPTVATVPLTVVVTP